MSDPVPELLLVEWVDSAQPVPGWHFLEDAPALAAVRCQSVGWMTGESDEVLMLAQSLGDIEGDSIQGSGFLRIPKSAIKTTKVLSGKPHRRVKPQRIKTQQKHP